MKMTRREMMKTGAAMLIGGSALPGIGALALYKIPICLGLWSVRKRCETDLPGVLAAVAKMGYAGIELAHSYYNQDAAGWRKLLDANGLKCCGMHTSLPKLQGAELQSTVDFHKTLGNRILILASLPKKNLESLQAIRDTGKQLNELAAKLKEHGFQLGYHCHAGDFTAVEGQLPWVVLGQNTSRDISLQMDVGNCLDGGGDPVALIRKFPGRSETVHLKDHGKKSNIIGEGEVKWPQVFEACERLGGTKCYVVEEESGTEETALDNVRRCLENLRKMGK